MHRGHGWWYDLTPLGPGSVLLTDQETLKILVFFSRLLVFFFPRVFLLPMDHSVIRAPKATIVNHFFPRFMVSTLCCCHLI